MTTFLLSHNLQVQSGVVPAWQGTELAEGLQRLCSSISRAELLTHPHWRLRIESPADPLVLARELVQGWGLLRSESGHNLDHSILALGGRKDTPAAPGSPLEQGAWGVDIVETADAKGFLEAINWEGMKAARPVDGVFEVVRQPR